MRVLVIGGTGFIGRYIVRRLVGSGHDVTVFHRGKTSVLLPNRMCEITDPLSATPLEIFPGEVLKLHPDVVVHTIAMGLSEAQGAVAAFAGKAARLVVLSSGDVYRAYGLLTGIESGPLEEGLLSESSSLRTVLFPYRSRAASPHALEYWYEKIHVEQAVLVNKLLPAVVLRLPKVYGPEANRDLATVYRYRHQPQWRWTHGYVGNVAAAVELAAIHLSAQGIYNVGEEHTPTVAERLSFMPASAIAPDLESHFNFAQNIAYDTSRIRTQLGYREEIPEREAMLKTLRNEAD
jgi:nucleoside-diphosphate-sugar epimerase